VVHRFFDAVLQFEPVNVRRHFHEEVDVLPRVHTIVVEHAGGAGVDQDRYAGEDVGQVRQAAIRIQVFALEIAAGVAAHRVDVDRGAYAGDAPV
jgi:hypothetical protein